VDATPKMRGKVYQLWERQNGKHALLGQSGAKPTSHAEQASTVIAKIVESKGYKEPGIITFKTLLEKEDSYQQMRALNFYGARGTNELEGCDAVFVLGTPMPPVGGCEQLAKMIFFERDAPFDDRWDVRRMTYPIVKDGSGWSYPVSGYWYDDDMTAVLDAYREAEILQAAHRGRPLHRDVDVWILANPPLPQLPLTDLLTLQDVYNAPTGVNIFLWDRVVQFAMAREFVTAADLVDGVGVNRHTAAKYLDLLAEKYPETFEIGTAIWQKGDRGRPPMGLRVIR